MQIDQWPLTSGSQHQSVAALLNAPAQLHVMLCWRRQDATLDRPSTSDPRWSLDNPNLWRCGAQPYEAWVCNLAYALLLKVL